LTFFADAFFAAAGFGDVVAAAAAGADFFALLTRPLATFELVSRGLEVFAFAFAGLVAGADAVVDSVLLGTTRGFEFPVWRGDVRDFHMCVRGGKGNGPVRARVVAAILMEGFVGRGRVGGM
jgi:hypothetical protein